VSLGIVSATQGPYSPGQFLLDAGQGARVAGSLYARPVPGEITLAPSGLGSGVLHGWHSARTRAESAPGQLEPGLLAQSVPGGGAYAGIAGAPARDGFLLAASRDGRISAVSLGSAASLPVRVGELLGTHRLVVADLSDGTPGTAQLSRLLAARRAGELLIALQRVPTGGDGELLWAAAAGLSGGGGQRELTSPSTREQGLIAASDLAPTILVHLGLPIPAAMFGRPISLGRPLDAGALAELMRRLRVIAARRLPALALLLGAWALLALAALALRGSARGAIRLGALSVLFAPLACLLPAALEPSAPVEYATIVLVCLALAALSDRLLGWPGAMCAPALATLAALTADALAGTQLLMRSLLGPDPAGGARFYGIGNELKSALAVMVLAGVAGALAVRRGHSRSSPLGPAACFLAAGSVLAIIEGSARVGAGVGGVLLVSFAFALAAALVAPGALTRRRALTVLLSPLAGLALLVAVDLLSAHGEGHFTGTVLDAHSAAQLREVIVRRYTVAWQSLRAPAMAVAIGACLLFALVCVLAPGRVLAPPHDGRPWRAVLLGGLAAGAVGALVEDSGPLLLVSAVLALACVVGYLRSGPPAPGGRAAAPHPGRRRIGRRAASARASNTELHDLLV